jgi:hypothetical protein
MRTFKDAEKYDVAERLEREIPLWGATDAEVQALFAPSQAEAEKQLAAFDGLETYCTFIGYPRSGHSIMGSLLDAHPNVIIAHELDALRFLEAGFSERQLFYLLVENSRLFTRHGRKWGAYSYAVPGQRQGEFTELRVIGDNKGGRTSTRIGRNWNLLAKLRDTVRLKHRFVHVVRNPFDNIATLAMRQTGGDIVRAVEQYFFMAQTNERLRRELGADVLDFPHEEFLRAPWIRLAELCKFLGVTGDEPYLNACSEIVYRIPHKSRHEVAWPRGTREFIDREKEKYDFLRGYSFDD